MLATFSHHRVKIYFLFTFLLTAAAFGLSRIDWESSVAVHTLMEAMATLLAFTVGALSLIRYYSHAENKYLLVGLGFIGAAILDGIHGTATSIWFHERFPSELQRLLPWSWFASRLFLSVMLLLSIVPWLYGKPQHLESETNPARLYFMAIFAICACLLLISFVHLPPAYYAHLPAARPEEALPAACFALALIGYLRQGQWRSVAVDHWMVLALIASLFCQAVFMPFSSHLFDTNFDVAHILKQLSYLFVLIGLLISTYQSFRQLAHEIAEHRAADIRNRMLVAAIEKSPVAVMVTNAMAKIDYCNRKALEMLGYESAEIIGRDPRMFSSGKTPKHTYDAMWARLKHGEDWNGIFFNRKKSGEELIDESHISPIMDEQRNITHYVAIKLDATERIIKERDTWHKANYDRLTDLPNRGLFLDRLDNALRNAKRVETNLALLFIDLDGFKAVNDTYGHQAGDHLLQWVASQISRVIRDNDTISRFGGDEFALLVADFTVDAEVRVVAEKVLDAISLPCPLGAQAISISASIGVALYPEHGNTADQLITRADKAMYHVKKQSGRGVAFHTVEV